MCIQKYLLNIIKISKLELTPDEIETYVIDHSYAYTREQENNYLLILLVIYVAAFIKNLKYKLRMWNILCVVSNLFFNKLCKIMYRVVLLTFLFLKT